MGIEHIRAKVGAIGPYDGSALLINTDQAIPTEGAKAKATIQQGYEKSRVQVELEPSGDNMLKGSGDFTINQDTSIMIFLKLPNQDAYAARFTPLKTKGGTPR